MQRRDVDLDEEHSKLVTYEFGRESAAARARVVEAMLSDLGRLGSDADSPRQRAPGTSLSRPALWDAGVDDVDIVSTELMMRQACYRSAAAAMANPVTASLAAFLA